ncbi:MAG: hypothetical protein V7K57_21935 [Nostoc sp.]|uniref:hypothetical protein n=1 Tax=Nostoc sp. TaxID=1180 RepID=UPI002FFA5B57
MSGCTEFNQEINYTNIYKQQRTKSLQENRLRAIAIHKAYKYTKRDRTENRFSLPTSPQTRQDEKL